MRPFRLAKSWTKATVAELLYRTGLFSLLAKRLLKGRAVVLMYHRVLPSELASRSFSHPGIIVTPETFAKHMAFLKRHFHPLTLAEFQEHMESGTPFPDRACLVTFDDGWFDNHDYALPILRAHKVPAVVFLATEYVDADQPFWQERLGHLLYESSRHAVGASILQSNGIHLPSPGDDGRLRKAIAEVVDRFRNESYSKIDALIADLTRTLSNAELGDTAFAPDQFLTWQQVRTLADSQITIASHTCSHRLLARLDGESVRRELGESRNTLLTHLGLETCVLAYPGGSYDSSVVAAAADAGYQLAFTTEASPASTEENPLRVPRINVHESSTRTIPLFLSTLLRLF